MHLNYDIGLQVADFQSFIGFSVGYLDWKSTTLTKCQTAQMSPDKGTVEDQ